MRTVISSPFERGGVMDEEASLQEEQRMNDMKMLTIVCREEFDDYVLLLFTELGITGYTVMPGPGGGSGKTGAVSGRGGTDRNTLFMVVLADAEMATLVAGMKELRADWCEEQSGREIPLKAFLSALRTDLVVRTESGIARVTPLACTQLGHDPSENPE